MAIGTLLLAYYAFRNIQNSQKQLKFFKQQINLLIIDQQPDLQIINYSFDGNKLKLKLQNSGKGRVDDIAVSSAFHIADLKFIPYSLIGLKEELIIPTITEKRKPEDIDEIKKLRNFFLNYLFEPKGMNILEPSELVVFPHNDEFSYSLPAGQTGIFQCEMLFYLKTKTTLFDKIFKDIAFYSRAISFDELKPLLLNNDIKKIAVIFYLLSKDKLQNVISHGRICDFIIDLSNDKNLEDAYKIGTRGPYPLDHTEIKSQLSWFDYEIYRKGKYSNINDDENDR